MRFWRRGSIQRNYVSGLDRFLMDFDQKPEANSVSRRALEADMARIIRLRDYSDAGAPKTHIWQDF